MEPKRMTTTTKTALSWSEQRYPRLTPVSQLTGTKKKFNSFSEMNRWLNNEMNQRLYKVVRTDWVENMVLIEGRKEITTRRIEK